MAGRRPRSLTSAEIAEVISFEEDIVHDNSDISTDDSYADPDYFGVFPPPHTPPSPTPGPSHTSSPSDTSNWLYAPSTRKKRRESRPSLSVRQQSSVIPSEDGGDDEYDDLDSSTITQQQPDTDKTCGTSCILLSTHHKTPLC